MSLPSRRLASMGLPLPSTLSPSKASTFKDCALAFRFSVIERIPEPPSPHASRGTLVHASLQKLYSLPPRQRRPEVARTCLRDAWDELKDLEEFTGLGLSAPETRDFLEECERLVEAVFAIEDPAQIRPIGLELEMAVQLGEDDKGPTVRGIIDRLELTEDGELVVTDYKTGKAPRHTIAQKRLDGVRIYALMCERLLGRRPARVQLHYLGDQKTMSHVPDDQSVRAVETQLQALWGAIRRACATGVFKEKPSSLCEFCNFRRWCPAWGGDPDRAATEAPSVFFGS